MITLYDYELSGNCYKVRLFLSILGIQYQTAPVEFFPAKEHKTDAYLRINPLGQLPALQDGEHTFRDAQAILSYLASRYDHSERWYPLHDAVLIGQVQMWLAFAESLTNSISAARLHRVFQFDFDIDSCEKKAHELLRVVDEHLWLKEQAGGTYLCDSDHPTIADIACFPYIALADEGGISLIDYPSIRRWTDRVKRIPGFVVMSGVFPTSSDIPHETPQAVAL